MERRSIPGGVKLETRADDKKVIRGHAAVYYDGTDATEFRLFDDVVERIMPGAFDNAVGGDVRALFNHDPNNVLGRSSANTLRMNLDQRGLSYEIDPPDTQVARDVRSLLERGDVSGSSFAFDIADGGSKWSQEQRDGQTVHIREVRMVRTLYDVGPVTFPAYEGTTSGLRHVDNIDRATFDKERLAHRKTLSYASAQARARLVEVEA